MLRELILACIPTSQALRTTQNMADIHTVRLVEAMDGNLVTDAIGLTTECLKAARHSAGNS